jgi:hypothetical protein
MKASILFGAGWENDSVEVLWRDPGRLFFRLWRNDAQGEKHAFIPILPRLGIRYLRASIASHTNSNFGSTLTVRRHRGRWSSCATAARQCWLSTTPTTQGGSP